MEQLSCAMNLYLQSVKPAPKRISCSSEIKFARSILLRFALASCLLLHCVRFVKYRQKFMIEKCQVRKRVMLKGSQERWVHKVMWNRVFQSIEKYIQNNKRPNRKRRTYILLQFFNYLCPVHIFKKDLLLSIFWRMH